MQDRFGNFRLLNLIDEGGMGKVFRAVSKGADGFEKVVALKTILPQYCSRESFIKLFRREALVAARLNHPNIVQTYHFDKVKDQYYIEMEFIQGINLDTLLKDSKAKGIQIPVNVSLDIMKQIAKGLEYAYSLPDEQGNPMQMIHRDLDPRNVLITYDGFAKIIDFGLAKAKEEISDVSTRGEFKGKVLYASPEQFEGGQLDNRTDLYALGVLIYEQILGFCPFKGDTLAEIIKKKLEANYRHPKVVMPTMPMTICNIITKCLEKVPENRFQSAYELLEAAEEAETTITAKCSTREYVRFLFNQLSQQEEERLKKRLPLWFDSRKTNRFTLNSTKDQTRIQNLHKEIQEFKEKAALFRDDIGEQKQSIIQILDQCIVNMQAATFKARAECEDLIRRVCKLMGKDANVDDPLLLIDDLVEQGVIPVGVAISFHSIRIISDKIKKSSMEEVITTTDATNLLVDMFDVLKWFYCDFQKGPLLPSLYDNTIAEKLAETEIASVLDLKTRTITSSPSTIISVVDAPLPPVLVEIESGPFWMGAGSLDQIIKPEETPMTKVDLPSFEIGIFPITNEEYQRFVKAENHPKPQCSIIPNLFTPNRPVTGVTHKDAVAYCLWLSDKLSEHYRLPTEAEWEKAARGGLIVENVENPEPQRVYPWGNKFRRKIANLGGKFGGVTDIQHFAFGKSPYGCFDMAGNVLEWCGESFDPKLMLRLNEDPAYKPKPNSLQAVRGGSWFTEPEFGRCSCREGRQQDFWSYDLGFRIVRDTSR